MNAACRHVVTMILLIALISGPAEAASMINASDFLPTAQVITFETGSTELPSIPGVTLGGGDATFNGTSPSSFIGHQYFGNLSVGLTFTALTVDFATPQQGVGGYLERVPFFPSTIVTTSVFDVGGALLGQYTTAVSPSVLTFVGFADPTGISRIQWTGSSPNGLHRRR